MVVKHTKRRDFGVCVMIQSKIQHAPFWMNPLLWITAGALICSAAASGQAIPAKLLQNDFQIMRRALEEAHGGIYRYTSKADMDRTFDRAYRRVDHPMTDLEFWRLVAPVVAHIKCGHTSIWVPRTLQTRLTTTIPLFPLVTRIFGDRLYIYEDLSSPGSSLEGAELLSINGTAVKKLLAESRTLVTGDGNTSAAKAYRIPRNGIFLCDLYVFGIESPFRVVYPGREGKRQSATVSGVESPKQNKIWDARHPEPGVNAEIQFLDDGRIAVLTIRHWYEYADPTRNLRFLDFLNGSFAEIQQTNSKSLIIDVRDNEGGLDAPGKQLFSFLWDQPFYYDKDIVCNAREFDFFKYAPDARPVPPDTVEQRLDGKFHLVKHPNVGLQQPGQPHFAGRVFALMNGGSFSTSCEFLSMLHFYKRAKFIGEEAAGGYYGCTAGQFVHVILPNSKLDLCFGLRTYYQAVSGYKYPDRGVIPDYPVTHTFSDLQRGRDGDMELALYLARAK